MYWARKVCRIHSILPIENIVFMGMGEPADNADAVVQAAQMLVNRQLFELSAKRVIISTVAPTPQAFANLCRAPVTLAWSVHASNDALRKQLVPTTRYSMIELRDGLMDALQDRSRSLKSTMLEVALMDRVNDNPEDALHLAEFCQPIQERVKLVVNLIPWNSVGDLPFGYRPPEPERVAAFQKVLTDNGVRCYIRTTRGDDGKAACGQLATSRKAKP